jgi:MFS family permease
LSEEERHGLLRHLYATIFLTSTALGTVAFLTPVFAEGIGATYLDLGIIGATGNAVYAAATILSGFLLDRVERVRFYTVNAVLSAAVILTLSLTTRVPQVVLVRGLVGAVSAGFWVGASTLTADISPPEALTRSVGRYNVSWIVGFVVGPVMGGAISDHYGFPTLFRVLAVLALTSFLVVAARLRGRITLRNRSEGGRFDLGGMRELLGAYLVIVPYAFILGIYMAIIPGHMKQLGISSSVIGLLLSVTNGVRGSAFLGVERLVGWGTRKALALASVLMCAALFLVSFQGTAFGFLIPLALYGLAGGIITPVVLDYIAHRTPRESLGAAMGAHEGIYGLGMCLGPMVGGAVAEAYGPSSLYLLLAAVSLVILPLCLGLRSARPNESL